METELELRPAAHGFDPSLLDELMAEAMHLMLASVSPINSIRIVPAISNPATTAVRC
jgi:hypothetical protein